MTFHQLILAIILSPFLILAGITFLVVAIFAICAILIIIARIAMTIMEIFD